MGKILCECGYIHSDTCGADGDLYKYDQIHEKDPRLDVFECCQCGNLMIDDPKKPGYMITFRPENSIYNKLLHDKKSWMIE